MTYEKREYSTNKKIQKQKKDINSFYASSSLKYGSKSDKHLIIDASEERTRKCLISHGIPNENIVTVDIECENSDDLHYKQMLSEFLQETDQIFNNVWADVINHPTNARKQVKGLFEKRLIKKGGIFAITICPRKTSLRSFGLFQPNLLKMAKRNNYNLKLIKTPTLLSIKCKGGTKYNIPKNMTYNGANKKTGRTMTAFYRVM
jgi:hypothetical protein